jgi:hypothetical protein
MTKYVHQYFFATLILISSATYGQLIGDTTNVYKEKRLHREGGSRFCQTEKSIGLVPEIQGFNNFFFGLGLSRANFTQGEGGGNGYGTTVALEFNPFDKVIAPKLNVWATGYIFFLGCNIGLNGIYYISDDMRNFVLRPEIGLGFIKVYLNYGYNLFLDDNISNLNKHTFTLSYYHTIYPWKSKK